MSDLGTLGMIGALFISAAFFIYYSTAKLNEVGGEIITGVVRGMPLATEHRTWLLWMTWLPQWAGEVSISLVYAVLFVAIGNATATVDIQRVAYLCAGTAGFGAVFTVAFGVPYIRFCLAAIRPPKAG